MSLKIKDEHRENLRGFFSDRRYRVTGAPQTHIKYEHFKLVLMTYCSDSKNKLRLGRREIENICRFLVERESSGLVNYQKFLDQFAKLGNFSAQELKKMQADKEQEVKRRCAQIMKTLKDGIKASNISYKKAFNKIDTDGSRTLDFSEFK